MTASRPTHSSEQITNTVAQPTADSSSSYSSALHSDNTNVQSTDSAVFGTSAFSATSMLPATHPPWLTKQSQAEGHQNSGSSPLALTRGQLRLSTNDASITGHFSTRGAAASGVTGGRALTMNTACLTFLHACALYLCIHECFRCGHSARGGDGCFI